MQPQPSTALPCSFPPLLTVDQRVASIMSAAEDAVVALRNECKRLLLTLPAKVRAGRRRRPACCLRPACGLVHKALPSLFSRCSHRGSL